MSSDSHRATSPTRAGDLLVVIRGSRPTHALRTQGEWLSRDSGGEKLHLQAPATDWAGFPLTEAIGVEARAWLLGELYGPRTSEEALLEVVRGRRSPATLNGHFLLIGHDSRRRRWSFVTDRFGTIHAYVGDGGGRTAVGTFFPAVAAAASRRNLDWIGISGLFGMGFFPGDRTFYDDVRILQPASRYVFDEDGGLISRERYWSWPVPSRRISSGEEALEAFGETFVGVMREMLDADRIAIPISGGLDSRSTVAPIGPELAKEGRLWTFSYGYEQRSAETEIGSRVAAARGLPHSSFEIHPYLFERLPVVLDSVEGFQDVTQCRQAAVVDELARRGDSLIAAHWGDVWMDSAGEVRATPSDEEVARLARQKSWKRGADWLLENLCRSRLGSDCAQEHIEGILTTQLQEISRDHEPDFRLKALKTESWGFRWTLASLRMYQAAVFPRLPFFDTRVTELLSAVPSSLLDGRQLQIEFLKRYAPDLARIRWQPYDADLYTYRRFDSWHLPRRAMKKAARALSRGRTIERNWEIQLLGDPGEQGLQEWLVRRGLRLHDLVPRQEVEALLEQFLASKHDPALGYTVSMLLTFSSWLERHG